MRAFGWAVLIAFLVVALSILGAVLGWFGRATQLVQEQVDPYEMQRKYEQFKDEAAQDLAVGRLEKAAQKLPDGKRKGK